jgi:hypothetical protein
LFLYLFINFQLGAIFALSGWINLKYGTHSEWWYGGTKAETNIRTRYKYIGSSLQERRDETEKQLIMLCTFPNLKRKIHKYHNEFTYN